MRATDRVEPLARTCAKDRSFLVGSARVCAPVAPACGCLSKPPLRLAFRFEVVGQRDFSIVLSF